MNSEIYNNFVANGLWALVAIAAIFLKNRLLAGVSYLSVSAGRHLHLAVARRDTNKPVAYMMTIMMVVIGILSGASSQWAYSVQVPDQDLVELRQSIERNKKIFALLSSMESGSLGVAESKNAEEDLAKLQDAEDAAEAELNQISERVKTNLSFLENALSLFVLIVSGLLMMATMYTSAAHSYIVRAILHFEQALAICGQHLSAPRERQFRAKFAECKDHKDFRQLLSELEGLAKEKGLVLTKFRVIGGA